MFRTWLAVLTVLALTVSTVATAADPQPDADGFYSLFDGKSLDGWKPAAENKDCAKFADGVIVVGGSNRGHLFYDGPVKNHKFKNFEFKAQVKVLPGSNSGIYIHTEYQDSGWPGKGFECQVCSNDYKDPRKTGSLYAVKDVDKSSAPDNQWFDYDIIVKGKTITIKINGQTTVEWTQPDDWKHGQFAGRKIDQGTFALQCHDPKSVVHFKNLRVKPLAD